MKLSLGIDVGTSAIRFYVINLQHEIIAHHRQDMGLESQSTQQDPRHWRALLISGLQHLGTQVSAANISDICLDGTSSTTLLIDANGEPLTHALMYHDTSAGSLPILADNDIRHPGLGKNSGLARICHLAGDISRHCIAAHQADWLLGWMSGQYGITDENNALKSGYDAERRAWAKWATALLPAHVSLPKVLIPGSIIGTASPALQELGFSATTHIRAGTTDSTASFLASGVSSYSEGLTTLGSTLVIKQLSTTPITDLNRGIYSHRLGNSWLTGGASNTGGSTLRQFFTNTELHQLSRHIDLNSPAKYNYYPLPAAGERFPVNDPELQPIMAPRPDSDADFLYELFDGMAAIEHLGYSTLQSLGCAPISRITSVGGGASNEIWATIRANKNGVPVIQAKQTEAAYGSALLGLHGSKLFDHYQ